MLSHEPQELVLSARILCADGCCTGIYGANAQCGTCGQALPPQLRSEFDQAFGPASFASSDGSDQPPASVQTADTPALRDSDAASSWPPNTLSRHTFPTNSEALDEGPPDLEQRLLCSDGACIGVIGSDGCCRSCAKPYEG